MARIIPFKNGKGFVIGRLPMPDGTYRSYKEYVDKSGKLAFRLIMERWKAERNEMLSKILEKTPCAMAWAANTRTGKQANAISPGSCLAR